MDEKILDLLTEMNNDLKSLKLDMKEFKTEMHNRFDKVEVKLEGVGGQFELITESRIDEFDSILLTKLIN